MEIDWTRSETIALAKESCTHCHGIGLRQFGRDSESIPCNCVLRNIFRACYSRFRYCVGKEPHMSHARLEMVAGHDGRHSWGRKDEEYIADFSLVSKRILDAEEYRIFRFHFLLGADWRLCCRQLKLERGVSSICFTGFSKSWAVLSAKSSLTRSSRWMSISADRLRNCCQVRGESSRCRGDLTH